MRLIAKTFQGLEEILADELAQIGAQNINNINRAVSFEGDKQLLYRANLELRTALRILVPISSFSANNEEQLYNAIYAIDWLRFMKVTDTLAIDAVVNSEIFRHSQYVALKAKDAIVDKFRNAFDERPSIDTYQPTLRIHIHINENECEVSLDSSGEALFKRGFERETLEAPINEVLAAGMILLSGWDKKRSFIDPMCGSGTFLIEAAMIAYNIPPLLKRNYFAFKHWANFDKTLWEEVIRNAEAKIKSKAECKIFGFDTAFQALRTSERNILAAELGDKISVARLAFEKQPVLETPALVMFNPPYDERIKEDDIITFYKGIGDVLKKKFKDSDAWLITSNNDALKHLGLRTAKRLDLNNGGLDCKFVKYELY